MRQVLTKWSSKTYCNVQKEDWGVVVVEDGLGERAKKKLFSHKKKKISSQ